jgi:hypothetical protein
MNIHFRHQARCLGSFLFRGTHPCQHNNSKDIRYINQRFFVSCYMIHVLRVLRVGIRPRKKVKTGNKTEKNLQNFWKILENIFFEFFAKNKEE